MNTGVSGSVDDNFEFGDLGGNDDRGCLSSSYNQGNQARKQQAQEEKAKVKAEKAREKSKREVAGAKLLQ